MEQHTQFTPGAISDKQDDWVSSPNTVRTDKDLIVKNFFVANNTDVRLLRGQVINRKVINANYTLATSDYLIGVTSLVISPSIGLPNPSLVGPGKTYRIKDEVGGALTTTITVRSEGEKLIDGAATSTLITNYASKYYYSDGLNWFTL